jgi:hypothetical protein
MRKIRFGNLAAVAGAALLCLGIPALGQDVTIDFTGVANTNVQALGAYAGYYTGTVTANGVTTASNPGFICDDYNDEIFLPSESWQATATSFASLVTTPGALSSTDFGGHIGLAGYAAIAYLSNLMITAPGTSTSGQVTQGDISAAIWYIGTIGSTNPLSLSSLDQNAQNLVTQLLGDSTTAGLYDGTDGFSSTADAAALAELEGSSLWIYTPTGADIQPEGDSMPQEFIGSVAVVSAPEGGAALLYLLLAMVACSGAMFFGYRDRFASGAVV